MTILIIGGTGNTGLPLAKLLHDAGRSIVLTSRSGVVPAPYKGVSFDWFNPSTYENPFNHVKENAGSDGTTPIDRIYIVGPNAADPMPFAKPFIDLAISKGVKRFVLLSGTLSKPGAPFTGKIHEYLNGTPDIDFTVLRATWFMENFSTYHVMVIKMQNQISTAAGDGRIPFISADDIAQAAFDALTSDEPGRRDIFIVGPELLNYDQVVALLSEAIGREITHNRLTSDGYKQLLGSFGLPQEHLDIFAEREGWAAADAEVETFNLPAEKKYVGKRTLAEFFKENASVWQ